MPIRIAICDDTAEDIIRLSDALRAYDPTFEIVTYTSGNEFLDDLLNADQIVDLLFLDIYLPGLDGIQTAQSIRDRNRDLKIIFVSSSQDHLPQAYDVFAFNYLVKPLDQERLCRILDRAVDELSADRSQKICFSYKSTTYAINHQDIRYIESRDKLLLFHLTNGRCLQCYGKLDELESDLPQRTFIRCHKSYVVNAVHITQMGEKHISLGQTSVGISRRHLRIAKDRYYAYLFAHMGRMQ